jgi:hypothetical protein
VSSDKERMVPGVELWHAADALRARLMRGVDMTSAVKYHGNAGIGRPLRRWVSSPISWDAAVIDTTRDALCGGIPRERPPW